MLLGNPFYNIKYANFWQVCHLRTAAGYEGDAFYEFGPGSNNPSRFHTPSQALRRRQCCR